MQVLKLNEGHKAESMLSFTLHWLRTLGGEVETNFEQYVIADINDVA
jgi:hypothetical protein